LKERVKKLRLIILKQQKNYSEIMPLPFLKKKKAELAGKGYVPVERVRELASRGFSEPEIIDVLRKEGFSPEEIDKGLTQALRVSVGGEVPTKPSPAARPLGLPTLEEIRPPEPTEMPVIPETTLPQEYYYPYSTEEYIDYAIKERMGEVYSKLEEFERRYAELERRTEEAYSKLNEFLEARASEEREIIKRIESVKDATSGMEGRLGSLEKAFKEVLPSLIESVRALSEVVQGLKRTEKKVEKKAG
jgi:hypothetical protein